MGSGPFMPVPVDVNVVKQTVAGRDRAFVIPPQFGIGSGAAKAPSVQLRNSTGAGAKLWFPNGGHVFDLPTGVTTFSNPIEIPAGGLLTLPVKSAPTNGIYHYHVYCEAIHSCAQGNSEPVVTVP